MQPGLVMEQGLVMQMRLAMQPGLVMQLGPEMRARLGMQPGPPTQPRAPRAAVTDRSAPPPPLRTAGRTRSARGGAQRNRRRKGRGSP